MSTDTRSMSKQIGTSMAEVKCTRCAEKKDSTFDFYWSGDKRQPYCKECMKKYARNWSLNHRRNRDILQTATASEEKGV